MACTSTASRGALPVRSPLPSSVPLITAQPAWIAARQLATTRPVSLWGWNSRSAASRPRARRRANQRGTERGGATSSQRQPEAHGVAHPELGPALRPRARGGLEHGGHEGQHEVLGRAGGVLQVQARAQAGVEHGPHGVEVGPRGLAPAAGPELVEGVVVAGRGEHAGLAHPDLAHQVGVAAGGPDPGRGLDGRAVPVALERALEGAPVGRAVGEELGLAHGAAGAGERAHEVVDAQAALHRERQAALLAVAVGGLGGPGPLRKGGRAVGPPVAGEALGREGVREEVRGGGIGDSLDVHVRHGRSRPHGRQR